MAITKTFAVALDMKRPIASRGEWEVVEGDSGNVIEITLTDDGEPVDLSGCLVMAVFGKPGGRTAEQDSAGNGITIGGENNNVITMDLYTGSFSPGQSNIGYNTCEIAVYSGENNETLVTSAQFGFKCRRSVLNDDTIESTDEYPILTALIVDATEATESARAATVGATGAAGDANAAAALANAKAALADEAAADADAKAALADEKANDAGAAAGLASDAAALANTKAALAAEAAEDADAAAEVANAAAAQALLNAQSDWNEADATKGTFIKNKPATYAPSPHAASHGSTGADRIRPADIGAARTSVRTTASLAAANWVGTAAPFTYTLAVTGVGANTAVEVIPSATITAEQLEALQAANIVGGGQSADSIVLRAFGDKPDIALPVQVIVRGDL